MVRVSLRTVTMQIPSQKIITKDNVSIDIAAVAYYHISDPEKAVIVIENVYNAINQISQTTGNNPDEWNVYLMGACRTNEGRRKK